MSGAWAVEIRKYRDRSVWAFPYYLPPGTLPPYPGFSVLEQWLDATYTDIDFRRLYNNGSPVLEIYFHNEADAFMFVLSAGAAKQ